MRIQNTSEMVGFHIGGLSDKTVNTSGTANGTTNSDNTKNTKNAGRGNNGQKSSTNILASELNVNQQDSIAMKQINAHKKAMKGIIDQFSGDKKIDDNMTARRQHMNELDDQISENQAKVNQIEDSKQKIKDAFGVTDDSEEQKDLELLEKEQESMRPGSTVVLTQEEQKKLKSMGPQTEYQTAILSYDSMESEWNDQISAAKKEKINENETIKAINKELLKSHPMVDAQEEAEDIIKEAASEVIGMLIDEAKDHIDDKMDEEAKKAEKEAEKKAEEEKAAKKAKEDLNAGKAEEASPATVAQNGSNISNSNQSDSKAVVSSATNQTSEVTMDISKLQRAVSDQQQIQTEIKTLVMNNKMTPDDIKGIVVDAQR